MPNFVKIAQKSLKGPVGIALPRGGDAYSFLVCLKINPFNPVLQYFGPFSMHIPGTGALAYWSYHRPIDLTLQTDMSDCLYCNIVAIGGQGYRIFVGGQG